MHNHVHDHLKFGEMFIQHRVSPILELGAGSGECTALLLSLPYQPRVVTISDGAQPTHLPTANLTWINGVSWEHMRTYPQQFPLYPTVRAVIIDTDHNYWTLSVELAETHKLLEVNGYLLLHDTESFDHGTGSQYSFRCGAAYPGAEIKACEAQGLMYGDALRHFLAAHPEYRLIRETQESAGAAIYQRTA